MELDELMKKLTSFDPAGFPVISLYLNAQADEHGRDRYDQFVRKQCEEIGKTLPLRSAARDSFERDVERIKYYLENELERSADGVAIFACSGAGFFEAAQLSAPISIRWRAYSINMTAMSCSWPTPIQRVCSSSAWANGWMRDRSRI
jgi:peptide subunit release factor 1 (eRF1)